MGDVYFPPYHTQEVHHIYILSHWMAAINGLSDKGEEGKLKTHLDHLRHDYIDIYKYTTPLYRYITSVSRL